MQEMDYGPFPYVPINRRPKWNWPNGARLAVWVIPNLEFFSLKTPLAGPSVGESARARRRRPCARGDSATTATASASSG